MVRVIEYAVLEPPHTNDFHDETHERLTIEIHVKTLEDVTRTT